MKRPKKEGNRHLFSAFSAETLGQLQSRLEKEKISLEDPFHLLNEKLSHNSKDKNNGLEQIFVIKEAGNHLQARMTEADKEDSYIHLLLDTLAFLFIRCKSKHPARRTIASILHGVPDLFNSIVVSCLTKNLLQELQWSFALQGDDENQQLVLRYTIETIMAFTENFPLGKHVLQNCDYEGLKFLLAVLSKEVSNARSSGSLDVQSQAMTNCLAAFKATIAVLHCQVLEEKSDSSSNNGVEITGNTLCDILRYSLDILIDESFMLDCRSAAGIAVVSVLQYLLSSSTLKRVIEILLADDKDLSVATERVEPFFHIEVVKGKKAALEAKIVQIVIEYVNNRKGCRFTKVIVCHGLITKLGAKILHSKDETPKVIIENIEKLPKNIVTSSTWPNERENDDKTKRDCFKVEDNENVCLVGSMKKLDFSQGYDVSITATKTADDIIVDPLTVHSTENICQEVQQKVPRSLFQGPILNCLLGVCATVNEKGMTVYAFRSLFCWMTEAYGHCKWLLNEENATDLGFYSPNGTMARKLLFTLNNYLDHPVDAVRHQIRNSLEKIIRIINLFPDSESQVKSLVFNWLQGNLRSRSKCLSLICILDHISVTRFLEIRETLPLDLLNCLSDSSLASHVCDLYVKSSKVHFSEVENVESGIDNWVQVWCEPVFKAISSSDRLKRIYVTDYIVPGLLKAHPPLICLILEKSKDLELCHDYVVTAIVFLSCARSLRECSKVKLDDKMFDSSEYWHGLARMEFMELCLCHVDEQVRLDCLAFICESNKSTETLQHQDFKLLKLFIPLNMKSQSPKFRSQFVCCLKKAVSRLADRYNQIKKKFSSENALVSGKRKNNSPIKEVNDNESFLKWLLEFLFTNLHSAACFPRVVTALEILASVLKILTVNGCEGCCSSGMFIAVIENTFTKDRIITLMNCLYDTFDVNRSLANEILLMLPHSVLSFTQADIADLFEKCLNLAYSSQPDYANVAPELIKFLSNSSVKDLVYMTLKDKFMVDAKELGDCSYNTHYLIIRILMQKLWEQVAKAENNLSNAAFSAPLHGTVQCIRELIRSVNIYSIKNINRWKGLIEELIHLSFRVTNIVGPVIQSSAPEGSLDDTGDHNVVVSQVLEESDKVSDNVETQAHLSQVLLVCCWRSMKEAVLLLGDIVSCVPICNDKESSGDDTNISSNFNTQENAPLETVGSQFLQLHQGQMDLLGAKVKASKKVSDKSKEVTGILSSKAAIKIGSVFLEILLSSRHIGAFELAYLGFVKVSGTFWKSQLDSLKVLPRKWIQDLLETLRSDDSSSVFCATRRSAGIPFYISAICSTEPVINKRKTFHDVMTVLVSIGRSVAEEETAKEQIIAQRVIGLNVLRAMFRDSKFGEDVLPYANDGLIIAIKGFSSSIWAIRNACTLLFSALMTRVFGVRKFPMSGTEFFSRFSSLYSFLKMEMEAVAEHFCRPSSEVQLHPSVFPLLFLLCHLYPSSMDGNDSQMKLSAFVPYIMKCGNSGVYKTRAMASRALTSIVTPGKLVETVELLIASLPGTSRKVEIRHNHINGSLLQILKLLQGKIKDSSISSSLKKSIITGPLISLEKHLWLVSSENLCSFNKAIFFEVINELLIDLSKEDLDMLSRGQKECFTRLTKACFNVAFHELGLNSALSEAESFELLQREIGHELLRKQCCMYIQNCMTEEGFEDLVKEIHERYTKKGVILKLLKSEFCDVRVSFAKWLCMVGNSMTHEKVVAVCLQERLIRDEPDVQCLAMICDALVKSPLSTKFPWVLENGDSFNCIEIWENLKEKCNLIKKRESFRAACQRLSLVFISHLHNEIQKSGGSTKSAALGTISEMFAFTRSSFQPEESLTTRYDAAKVIGNEEYLAFITDRSWIHVDNAEIVFQYWKCVIDLLQDEDSEIRGLVASSVFPFIRKFYPQEDQPAFVRCPKLPTGFCVQPSYALEGLVKTLAGFYSYLPNKVCNFFMSMVIGRTEEFISQFSDTTTPEEFLKISGLEKERQEEHVVIFEESEANAYKEDLTLGHIAFDELQDLICMKGAGIEVLNKGFVAYLRLAIKEFFVDPKSAFPRSHLKISCQILLGICVLFALDHLNKYADVKDHFQIFSKKLDECISDGFTIENCVIADHVRTARWMCNA